MSGARKFERSGQKPLKFLGCEEWAARSSARGNAILRVEVFYGKESLSLQHGVTISISLHVGGVGVANELIPFAISVTDALDDLEDFDPSAMISSAETDPENAALLAEDFKRIAVSLRAELFVTC